MLLLLGYYTGGYVAGRMSRFDGGMQGFGVWLLGLVVAVAVAILGVVLGREYDLRGRVDLSGVSASTEQLGWQVLAGAGLLVLARDAARGRARRVGRPPLPPRSTASSTPEPWPAAQQPTPVMSPSLRGPPSVCRA